MILIDDGQTVKKLLNHAYCAGLALSYSERWLWLIFDGVALHPVGAILFCRQA